MDSDQRILNLEAEIESLKVNNKQLQNRMHFLEEVIDTIWTPWWKKAWFVIDGWPLYRIAEKRQWRPWH
jgi:hypothetical protein